jgi:hypothetical protein
MAGRIGFGAMTIWFTALAKACNQGPGPEIVHLGEGDLQSGSFALEIIKRWGQRGLLSDSVYRCQNYRAIPLHRQDSHSGVVHPGLPGGWTLLLNSDKVPPNYHSGV